MSDTCFSVVTGREDSPVGGLDSMIISPPQWAENAADRRDTLLTVRLGTLLRRLSEFAAERLGELLHHAEWVLTADPETVRRVGSLHDCVACQAATDQALAYLTENPGKQLLVGVLYWAGKRE